MNNVPMPKRLTATRCGIVAMTLIATHASALQSQFQSTRMGGTYTAQAIYGGTASLGAAFDMKSPSPVRDLVWAAQNYYTALNSALNAQLDSVVAATPNARVTVPYPGLLSGTATASIAGLGDGNLQVTLGGLRYSAHLSARGTGFSCESDLSIGDISFTSKYNPVTGAVSGATPHFAVATSTQCDSVIGWVPFLGDYVARSVAGAIDAQTARLNASSGKMLDVDPQLAIFGLANAIKANTYMVGGIDAGMYLKNNIASLYTGKQITISIADEATLYAPTIRNMPGPRQYSGPAFVVSFSDNGVPVIAFKVVETNNYTWTPIGDGDSFRSNSSVSAGSPRRPLPRGDCTQGDAIGRRSTACDDSETLLSRRRGPSWGTRADPSSASGEAEVVTLLQSRAELDAVTLLAELQRPSRRL